MIEKKHNNSDSMLIWNKEQKNQQTNDGINERANERTTKKLRFGIYIFK